VVPVIAAIDSPLWPHRRTSTKPWLGCPIAADYDDPLRRKDDGGGRVQR
jgi:hypothetical protein